MKCEIFANDKNIMNSHEYIFDDNNIMNFTFKQIHDIKCNIKNVSETDENIIVTPVAVVILCNSDNDDFIELKHVVKMLFDVYNCKCDEHEYYIADQKNDDLYCSEYELHDEIDSAMCATFNMMF